MLLDLFRNHVLAEAVSTYITTSNVSDLYRTYVLVESSNINSFWYDPDNREMRVRFLSGAEYSYSRVPERIFIALLNANSHGSKFWELARTTFQYERLADWDDADWDDEY